MASERQPPRVFAYGVAVVTVGVALALTAAVPLLWERSSLMLLLAAVMVSALYGGFGPGLVATLLAGASSTFVLFPPYDTLALRDRADVIRLVIFVTLGVAISRLSHALLRAGVERQRLHDQGRLLRDAAQQARLALGEHEARAAAILNAALDCIITMDDQGRVIEFNPAAEKTFRYARVDAIGRPLVELIIPPTLRERHRAGLRRYLATGTSEILSQRIELTAMRAEGSEFPVELTVMPIRRDGSLIFTGFLRDLTTTKQAEAALRQHAEDLRIALAATERAHAEAEEASRLKDEFLATVSHELRTPLAAMMGWIAALKRQQVSPERKAQALDVLEHSARAQAKLVDDLLNVSRIVTGGMRLDFQPVDLVSVIDAALSAVRPTADAKGVGIGAVLHREVGHVAGDGERLQQVVWNLLSNAVKFTPSGGHVEITLERRDGQARIVVRDTGQGIRPDFLPYVFDAFRQADAGAASRRQGGMGLGLTIVRRLVELHGGRVEASSDGEGCGATFTVTLPLAPLSARDSTAA